MAESAGHCQVLDAARPLRHQRAQHRGVARPIVQLQIAIGLFDGRVELIEQGAQQRPEGGVLENHDRDDI
ncbi:hypothetical protein G6F63_013750 [Rhizopus arrhizus]|nr:hypothetical protein G6F23_013074 [Rhizopus arrhizus]KAG1321510.1 hypothetical protein G6F63_013750 [Rhizopus arrhizus]KAG1433294.1 hypothetical protein G6F56_014623 [Rhizopus delemar]